MHPTKYNFFFGIYFNYKCDIWILLIYFYIFLYIILYYNIYKESIILNSYKKNREYLNVKSIFFKKKKKKKRKKKKKK